MKTSKICFVSALAMCATLAAGCNSASGTLNVLQPLKLTNQEGAVKKDLCKVLPKLKTCRNLGTEEIPAGEYTAKLSASGKTLKIKITQNGMKKTIKVALPKGTSIPNYEGSVNLPASQLNIAYDVAANVDTQESDSGQMTETRSCTWYTYVRECYTASQDIGNHHDHDSLKDRDHDGDHDGDHGQERCYDVSVAHPGLENVTYHDHYTNKTMAVSLNEPGTANSVANFQGSAGSATEIIDYTSGCAPY